MLQIILLLTAATVICGAAAMWIDVDLFVTGIGFDYSTSTRRKRKRARNIGIFLTYLTITLCLIIVGILLGELVKNGTPILSSPWSIGPAVLSGIIFYWMRTLFPVFYGTVESCIGSAAIFLAVLAPNQQNLPKLIALVGGIYIIVRGLDNISKGLTPEWRAKLALLIPQARS